jgi:hypothetical protein
MFIKNPVFQFTERNIHKPTDVYTCENWGWFLECKRDLSVSKPPSFIYSSFLEILGLGNTSAYVVSWSFEAGFNFKFKFVTDLPLP